MGIVRKITLRYLLRNPARTLLTVAAIALSVGMLCAVAGFAASLRDILEHAGVITRGSVGSALSPYYAIAAVAGIIIVICSVIVISNAFYISSSERLRQFGMLGSVGATGKQLGQSVVYEAAVLSAAAIPLGIALGASLQSVVARLANTVLREAKLVIDAGLDFRVALNPLAVVVAVVVALLTVLVSAWLPARKAARTSPVDAIRQAGAVQIRLEWLKTPRLVEKLFGFEGALAAKSLKRNRSKYRATVICLTLSVVLVVSMSSLVWLLNQDARVRFGGYDYDVLMYIRGDLGAVDGIDAQLQAIPNDGSRTYRYTVLSVAIPDGFYTERALESGMAYPGEYAKQMILYAIPDDGFLALSSANAGVSGAVLLNNAVSTINYERINEFAPYNCAPGTTLTYGVDMGADADRAEVLGEITVESVTYAVPWWIPADNYSGSNVNLVVSESTFRGMYALNSEVFKEHTTLAYFVTVADSPAYSESAKAVFAPFEKRDGFFFRLFDASEQARQYRNLIHTVAVFGYGFIAMLSLIAVTSVVTTISTGMALRRREFAMLVSVGMTPGGMNKMLAVEALLYGARSVVVGLPLGVALSLIMYLMMSGGLYLFPYQPPWRAMAASVAAVLLLTFATMRYSRRGTKKASIAEALRSETA